MNNMISELFASVIGNLSLPKLTLASVIAGIGGFAVWFLGGWDTLIITQITLMVIDYITGVAKAVYQKKLSSSVGFKGIIKKILILLVVGLSVTLQNILPEGVPLREVTVLFFIANEGFSILENADGLIPLPKKLRSILAQIQNEAENKGDSDTEINDSEDKSIDE